MSHLDHQEIPAETSAALLRAKQKKRKKRAILLTAAFLIFFVLFFAVKKDKQPIVFIDPTNSTVLSPTDLIHTISGSGIVESAESTTVYSTMSYPVQAVYAEVGDYVQAGDLLAELDARTLLDQINAQSISKSTTSANSAAQVEAAQDNYNHFKENLDSGLNTTLNNAQIQADNAYRAYEQAQRTYSRYLTGVDMGENTALINAEAALRTAETALDTAQASYDSLYEAAQQAYDTYHAAKQQWEQAQNQADQLLRQKEELERENPDALDEILHLETELTRLNEELLSLAASCELARETYNSAEARLTSAETALEQAADNYDIQNAAYHAALTGTDQMLEDYKINVDTAWTAYENALVALEAAKKSTQDQLETYENNLNSAKNGATTAALDESIRQLRVTLEDTKITAPVSGTVTAVYAEVGSPGSGLLFVIEDTEHLVVHTAIKGYDIGLVREGMPVLITSDSTGDAKISGVLTTIAPTANKTMQGITDTTTDTLFSAEAKVAESNTGLRIGMEVQLDFVLKEAAEVLTVPYDAVYENESGQSCIITLIPQKNDTFLLQEETILLGIDNELDIAISGKNIQEGVRVLNEPAAYLPYIGQTLPKGIAAANSFHSMPPWA